MNLSDVLPEIRSLPIWQGEVVVQPLAGGITNVNFVAEDAAGKFVVRVGDDIPLHQIMRFNERSAAKAAHAVGLSPAVRYAEGRFTVLDFIEGRTLAEADIRDPNQLPRVLDLVISCHRDLPTRLRGPVLVFWVFHVIRDYGATLLERRSGHAGLIPDLLEAASMLEKAAGPFDIVFGHNDLLSSNVLDDGERLWLIDFDYAGFNTPLFDLGGLASNNGLSSAQEDWMLETYFATPLTDELRSRYAAMKCASLLRETMWSMVSEITSTIDFDYAAYTAENLARFRAALNDFQAS